MLGSIPVLSVRGKTLSETWEKSLVELYARGSFVKTQYDSHPELSSKDSTMIMVVEEPLSEPMIHQDCSCSPVELQEYVMEFLEGLKDDNVRDPDEPNDTRWDYTYHQRLFEYDVPPPSREVITANHKGQFLAANVYDQIEVMCQKLAQTPYTRRAQAVTWKVWEDNDCYDPACLQSIWCRIVEGEDGQWVLNTNVRFRANDAYKSAFPNMFALAQLQQKIASRVTFLARRQVSVGRYVHHADSYHLYGAYFEEFENDFLVSLASRSFEERTLRYEDCKESMESARRSIMDRFSGIKGSKKPSRERPSSLVVVPDLRKEKSCLGDGLPS